MADTPDCVYAAAPTAAAKVVATVLYRNAPSTSVCEYLMGRAPAPFVPADARHIIKTTGLSKSRVYAAINDLVTRAVIRRARREIGGEEVDGFELHRRRANEPDPRDQSGNPTPKNQHPPELRLTSQEICKHRVIAEGIARDWRGAAARVGITFEDVQQTALLWLVRAAQTYDPKLGTFPDYARRWVKQGVRRLLPRAGAVTTAREATVADHARAAECAPLDPEMAKVIDTTDADLGAALLCLSRRHRWLLRENYGLGRRSKVKPSTGKPVKRAGAKIRDRVHWSWAKTRQELAEAVQALAMVLQPLEGRGGSASGGVVASLPSPNPLPSRPGGGTNHGGPTAGRGHARKNSQKP